MTVIDVVYFAALVFAAGYLLALRRRSRRAAGLGLAAIALYLLFAAQHFTGLTYANVFRRLGMGASFPPLRAERWAGSIHVAVAWAVLIWAVLADRRRPADAE